MGAGHPTNPNHPTAQWTHFFLSGMCSPLSIDHTRSKLASGKGWASASATCTRVHTHATAGGWEVGRLARPKLASGKGCAGVSATCQ
jgi:hypothetical protein